MIKLNILAFTLMIQIRKKNVTDLEIKHAQRLREINDQNLDRRAKIFPFM